MFVSVYKSIDGEKLRRLCEYLDCSKFEAVGILVLFWLWGKENADENGVFRIGLRTLNTAFINHTSDCGYTPNMIVDALVDTGWIDVSHGMPMIHDWRDWEKKVDTIETSEENMGRPKKSKEETEKPENEPKKYTSRALRNDFTEDFEAFWSVYPRKIGKINAFKVYNTRLKEGYSPNQLLKAAENYSYDCRKKHTDEMYIKHPSTFIGPSLPFLDYLGTDGNGGTQNNSSDDDLPFLIGRM